MPQAAVRAEDPQFCQRILAGTRGWLRGLPDRVTLITVGQEFVQDGQSVRTVDETALETAPGEG